MARYNKHEAQDWAWENLHGEWTTLITPFTSENELDEDGLRHNIRHIRSLGTAGAGCTWGMGEFWSLTFEERVRIMEVVADEAAGVWPVASHVTNTSAKEVVAAAHRAEDLGFELLVLAAPYMVTKTEDQVFEFVRTVAEATNLAIMFYNSPQFGIVMSPQGLKRLCTIPNVVGVKEASFSQQISIETHLLVGRSAIVSTPDEWIFAKAKELGFRQQVVFANTSDWRFDTPEANHYVRFIDRATKDDLDQEYYNAHLRPLKELSDLWWGRTMKRFGGALPVSMVKYWGQLMGLKAGHVRPPLVDLSQDEKEELRQALAKLRPLDRDQQSSGYKNGQNGHEKIHIASTGALTATKDGRYVPRPANDAGMMLMVSVQDMKEALEAERGGADVVDVKNLQEALVGSGHPMLVEQVREAIPSDKHVSVTLGVVPTQPGTVAMAVYAAAQLQATSVKVGFMQADYATAVEVLQEARQALKGSDTKLIGSLFADNVLYEGGLDAHRMVELARDGDCDGWLIDTLTKDGRNLFDFLSEKELRDMVFRGKKLGMSTALSGHLKMSDLDELARVNPDIVGVRGAVCSTGDRTRSVAWEAVAAFKLEIDRRKRGEVDVRTDNSVDATERGEEPTQSAQGGWLVIDGRGKTCAGVIAAVTRQVETDGESFIETVLADALNIYDIITWAEQDGHRIVTQRKDGDGTVRVLIQPFAGVRLD